MILVLFFLLPFLNLTLVIFNYYTSKISSQYLFYEIDNHTNNVYNIFITSVRFKEGFEMSDLPQISEAEFEVMKIVWKHAPISTNEITDKLLQTTSWSPKTIQTLIKRLVTKGVLTYEKQSRVFVYTPVVKERRNHRQRRVRGRSRRPNSPHSPGRRLRSLLSRTGSPRPDWSTSRWS